LIFENSLPSLFLLSAGYTATMSDDQYSDDMFESDSPSDVSLGKGGSGGAVEKEEKQKVSTSTSSGADADANHRFRFSVDVRSIRNLEHVGNVFVSYVYPGLGRYACVCV
jgi:hypothetical protein